MRVTIQQYSNSTILKPERPHQEEVGAVGVKVFWGEKIVAFVKIGTVEPELLEAAGSEIGV